MNVPTLSETVAENLTIPSPSWCHTRSRPSHTPAKASLSGTSVLRHRADTASSTLVLPESFGPIRTCIGVSESVTSRSAL